MKEYSTKISLILKCEREEIPNILKVCEEHIGKMTMEISKTHQPVDLTIMSKIKWVLSEMLSNVIKHSGVNECRLNMMISEKQLIIEKEDSGNPLALNDFDNNKKITWPLRQTTENQNFQIYHNGIDSLRVRTAGQNKAIFFIDEFKDLKVPESPIDISEHFGLLIMTKASDTFMYEFDPDKKVNRFTSNFNLK